MTTEGLTDKVQEIRAQMSKDLADASGILYAHGHGSLASRVRELEGALKEAIVIIDGALYCGHELNGIGEENLSRCRAALSAGNHLAASDPAQVAHIMSLVDEQIDAIFNAHHNPQDEPWINWRRFARAIASVGITAQKSNTSS